MADLTRAVLFLTLAATLALNAAPQDSSAPPEEDFRVYTDHPRLFLPARRLRLLRRERERDSMRWTQFDALVRGGAPLKEPGLAFSLYYQVSGEKAAGRKAIEWAMTASDLRQIAIVYDWCHDLLSDTERRQLASRIHRLSARPERDDLAGTRDRVLAAVAAADEDRDGSERMLRQTVREWWRVKTAPRLVSGDLVIAHAELSALEEVMHAVRDNLRIDLRDNAGDYFNRLPIYELVSYYPAPFRGGDSDLYIPVSAGAAEPDLQRAILSRVADLSLVAYDSNAQQSQYVQGWVMQDRCMLRDTLGAPYEFLWGNPYQPGLSYYQVPLTFHDPISGALFVRSSWDDDASWFGLIGKELQLFENGKAIVLGSEPRPIELGDNEIVFGHAGPLTFESSGETTYVVGLSPLHPWLVEPDDEEMQQADSDRRGTIELQFPQNHKFHVVIHEQQ